MAANPSNGTDDDAIGDMLSYRNSSIVFVTNQADLTAHSAWDGRSPLNVRMEDMYSVAERQALSTFWGGIGGVVPDVQSIELTKHQSGNWIWVAKVNVHQGHYDGRTPKIGAGHETPETTVIVPFHLDGTHIRWKPVKQ
jgi:hypothetical protein